MTDTPDVSSRPPAGWYWDPHDQTILRWWDGARWTKPTRAISRNKPRSPQPGQPSFENEVAGWPFDDETGDTGPQRSSGKRAIDGSDGKWRQYSAPSQRGEEHAERANTPPGALNAKPTVSLDPSLERSAQRGNVVVLALSALFGVSLVVFAVGRISGTGALSLVGLAGVLFLGVGTAPLQLSERARLDLRLAVAGIVGLSVPLVWASIMVLTPTWHPLVSAVALGVIAVGLHIYACYRALMRLPARTPLIKALSLPFDASVVCTAAGTVLWCAAALGAGHVIPGVLGFLPKISVFWYVGLFFVLAGIVLARGRGEARAIFAVVSLLAAINLTPALVYGMPESQSAAKHVDLVQFILQVHHLDRGAGIYNAYSGFFSAIAWLCDVAGVRDAMGIATYWPFIIGLVGLAELRLFFGSMTSFAYRIWAAITIAVLVNSIGADYFSPQSVGFVLAVGVYGLVLNHSWPGLGERGRLALLLLAGCSMAVTHELSPYIAGGALLVLVVLRTIRPWYVPALILIPAGLWGLLNLHVVSNNFSLYDLGNLSNFTAPKTVSTPGLQRLPIVGESSHALLLGLLVLIGLAGIGFARTFRNGSSWAFLLSAGVGLSLIAINPYGNEGIFRSALFGIPWLALLALYAVPALSHRWVPVAFGSVAAALAATYLIAMFGLDNANVIRSADFEAFQIYDTSTSPSSYILTLSYGDLPSSVTTPSLNSHYVAWSDLITQAQAESSHPDKADSASLARQYVQYADNEGGSTKELYAIWSPASVAYAVDYGLETSEQAQAWRNLLIASPDWRVIYHSDGTYLFRVVISAAK